MKRKVVAVGASVVALAAGGAGAALAVGGDDQEGKTTGPAADRAAAKALEFAPGGTVRAVERDSENGATWEVEVTKPDGTTVDVRLDGDLSLVVIDDDSETADENGEDTGA